MTRVWCTSIVFLLPLLAGCSGTPTSPTTAQPVPVQNPALAISCPQGVSASAVAGTEVPVSFSAPTVTGGVAPVQVSCTRQSGSMFGGGVTPVQCTATDAVGQSTSCIFDVTINSTAPTLTKTKFLAFGDSMTAGELGRQTDPRAGRQSWVFFVSPTLAYPTKLQTALRTRYTRQSSAIEVINEGWPGERAEDGAKRFEQILPRIGPEVVIVLEGVNDLASLLDRGVNPAAAAIDRMAREARNRGVSRIIATLPPGRPAGDHAVADSLIRSLNSQVRSIAAAEGAVLVDFYEGMRSDTDRYISQDGVHPTEAGYERMAELVATAIRTNFEPRTP